MRNPYNQSWACPWGDNDPGASPSAASRPPCAGIRRCEWCGWIITCDCCGPRAGEDARHTVCWQCRRDAEPETYDCDGCGVAVPVDEIMLIKSPHGEGGFCPRCRGDGLLWGGRREP